MKMGVREADEEVEPCSESKVIDARLTLAKR